MKIELSPDQNTLEIDGVIYEAKPECNKCEGCAFRVEKYNTCNNPAIIPFESNVCTSVSRNDGNLIIWVRKYEN